MRVFTDGACSKNGQANAKAGYAVYFPDHRDWTVSGRVPDACSQTNQRAELTAIAKAVEKLLQEGCQDEDLVIYTDSDYSIKCLTIWLSGWMSRNWKTSEGKDVLHRDLIEATSRNLCKFKSYRFQHVRAHTGGKDDISRDNDIVDKLARASIDDQPREVSHPVVDELFPGCPLRLMGPPVVQREILDWMRANLSSLEADVINKHLYKAFAELCKARDVNLAKQTIQGRPMIRAEGNLHVTHVQIEKLDD